MRIENAIDTIMLSVIELKEVVQTAKLGPWINGPYRVTQTHVNGTLTIELRQGVTERINIRRVIPYKE